MKNLLFLFFLMIASNVINAQQQMYLSWAEKFSGYSIYLKDIKIDNNSNILVGGYFRDSIDIDPSSNEYILKTKYSNSFNGFVAKFTREGKLIWAKSLEGGESFINSIDIDTKNNIIITGTFKYLVDFDPGVGKAEKNGDRTYDNGDIFLAKYDQGGNFAWVRHVEACLANFPRVLVDEMDDIYLVGSIGTYCSSYNYVDFNMESPGTNRLMFSEFNEGTTVRGDGFLAKFDKDNTFVWKLHVKGLPRTPMCKLQGSQIIIASLFKDTVDIGSVRLIEETDYDNYNYFFGAISTSSGLVNWSYHPKLNGSSTLAGFGVSDSVIYLSATHDNYSIKSPDFDPGSGTVYFNKKTYIVSYTLDGKYKDIFETSFTGDIEICPRTNFYYLSTTVIGDFSENGIILKGETLLKRDPLLLKYDLNTKLLVDGKRFTNDQDKAYLPGLDFDSIGNIYLAGQYMKDTLELLPEGKQLGDNGNTNSYIVNYDRCLQPVMIKEPGNKNLCPGTKLELNVQAEDLSGLPLQYQWYKDDEMINGKTDTFLVIEEVSVENAGTYYCKVSNDCYSISSGEAIVNVKQPFQDQVCLVTVDWETGKNKVIWRRTHDKGTKYYTIYRESNQTNRYDSIGWLPFDSISIFIDSNSIPESQQQIYKITATDSCGTTTSLANSDSHKTLLLQYAGYINGVNLNWNNKYEVNGIPFIFDSYIIYRGTSETQLDSITSVSGNTFAFIDTSSLAANSLVYYRVAGLINNACDPRLKSNNGPFSRSLSNLEDNRQRETGINLAGKNREIKIYPNPFIHSAAVVFDNPLNSRYTLRIINVTGRVVREVEGVTGDYYPISKDGLVPGFYMLELTGDKSFRGSFIIE